MKPLVRRCGHGSGAFSPEDQAAVDAFRAMLAARKDPQPWIPGCRQDIALKVGPFIERARPRPGDDYGPHVIAVALVPPNVPRATIDGVPHTGWLLCETSKILGVWNPAYELLTHAAAGRALPDDVGMDAFEE